MAVSEYDVAIVGGGSGGFSAAVAAGRMGRDVVLIEAEDVLGGASTTNLVNDFCNGYWDGERFIIGGIFEELRHRLIGRKALYQTRGPHQRDKIGQEPFNPDRYGEEIEIMCREADVDIRFDSYVTGAEFPDDTTGRLDLDDGETVQAKTVIDATGDAVVAHNVGVPTTFGREKDDWVQPVTYYYMVGPVDVETLRAEIPEAVMYDENTGEHWASLGPVEEIHEMVVDALESGELDLGVTQLTAIMSVPGTPEQMTVNFNHIDVEDPTDEEQLAEATREGKRRMEEAVGWLRETIPGFEDIEVVREANKIGVRQSRQIEGLYQMTKEDVLKRRQFDDVIAQSCFQIDIHKAGEDRDWVVLPKGTHYDIPWRTIIPESGPPNLTVAGRCVSADSVAMSTVRMTPSAIAIGEAAGVTAALAADGGVPVRDVEVEAVQNRLRDSGATLS